ncbi:MAG: helix-turn-helix domain-containing protein [Muribaculaceae bacterium]|nr:helix-turn-helix domain-containing protein [Muribaculaceae bacterium]
MKDRIKKLRKSLDMTQQDFADRIGVKRNTIGQYEIGRNEPIETVINLICREFNVNEEWLRYGEGEMFNPAPTDALDQLAQKYKLSNADYVMIERFVNLRPEVRQNIYDYFKEVVSVFAHENMEPQIIAEDPALIVPDTPEELEERFPPVEDTENSAIGQINSSLKSSI